MFNMRKKKIRKSLDIEINRAKRFGYYVGVLLVDVAESTPRGVHKHLPGFTVYVRHFRSLLREYDIVLKTKLRRYTVILPHLEAGESAGVVKDRIKFTSWTRDWGSVNIGIAIYPTDGKSSKELIQTAENDLKTSIKQETETEPVEKQ